MAITKVTEVVSAETQKQWFTGVFTADGTDETFDCPFQPRWIRVFVNSQAEYTTAPTVIYDYYAVLGDTATYSRVTAGDISVITSNHITVAAQTDGTGWTVTLDEAILGNATGEFFWGFAER